MTRIHHGRLRSWRLALASLVSASAGSSFGCDPHITIPQEPSSTTLIPPEVPLLHDTSAKVDILLAIDNSGSMADKQGVLALAVPDLIQQLVNPRCLDPLGRQPAYTPPDGQDCPAGLAREFPPIRDMHIGIISTSLGGHGARTCLETEGASNVDMGHLLARINEDSPADIRDIPTYQGKGFLAWDPLQKLDGEPTTADANDGEADLSTDSDQDLDNTALVPTLTDMVKGVGQSGCGLEAQLESWYRFLIDPDPYETITVKDNRAVPEGTDRTILQQRADFLRPNSLLVIVLLSDENDCSIRDEGVHYLAAERRTPGGGPFQLWRPRTECATDPSDPCCKSCQQPAGDCPADPNCTNPDGTVKTLSALEDAVNLRCFEQKRRFGFDFLYSIERYTNGLKALTIADRNGHVVPNPIFSDLNPNDELADVRNKDLVFFAGIVGVPWQDIARLNEQGQPDILAGKNAEGKAVGGFKDFFELSTPVAGDGSATGWDVILGDPARYKRPEDPHMIESVGARSGANPITGDEIRLATETDEQNEINGNDRTIAAQNDLQYACVFPLPTPRPCAAGVSCDCEDPANDSPLCDPADRTLQVKAKAYPGIRELQLIKSVETQGIVGSVCPRQLDDDTAPDFGYRPAIGAILDRLTPTLGRQCLPRTLTPDAEGQVACTILEARRTDGACSCADYPARKEVAPEQRSQLQAVLAHPNASRAGWNCVCEVEQLEGEELRACQEIVPPASVQTEAGVVNGWCYIDASTTPPTGNPELVATCPATERRQIRFVNQGAALPEATLFIRCPGE